MPRTMERPEPISSRWLGTVEKRGMLPKVLKEIKSAKPREVSSFLSEVLKRAKSWMNPFYGDHSFPGVDSIPQGITDIRDEDHDQDEIYHVFLGGLHCFLIEVLGHAVRQLPASESLVLAQQYFDYFFDKHRGCTSCAKRVLALMPEDKRSEFLLDRVNKRKEAYLSDELHSPACMEMSLWLLIIAPLSAIERTEIAGIIAHHNWYDVGYLIKYSHQRSVRGILTDLVRAHMVFPESDDLVQGNNFSRSVDCPPHMPNAIIVLQGGQDAGKVRCTLCETTMLPTQLL